MGDWSAVETEEMSHHNSLMIVSLISLSLFCIFIAFILVSDILACLFLGNVFLNLSLLSQTWVEFIFRPHPDHLLMLFCGIAGFFTLKYCQIPNRTNFVRAAIFWGIATAVKRSTILFIPSFLYLFLSEGFDKHSFKKGFEFIGIMLIAYLIIGFPQNFGFYKHISFMLGEIPNSRPPTWFSVKEYVEIIYDQTKYIFLFGLVAHILFGTKQVFNFKRFVIFSVIAILMVLSGSMVTPHHHHPMPVIGVFIIAFISLIRLLPTIQITKNIFVLPVFSILILMFLNQHTNAVESQKNIRNECRKEAKGLLKLIKAEQANQTNVLGRDPYFPFDSSKKGLSRQYWGTNPSKLDSDNISLFGTKRSFGEQFLLDGPAYNMHDNSLNWDQKKSFYQVVLSETEFSSPAGKKFKKIYEDDCGFLLFKKVQ